MLIVRYLCSVPNLVQISVIVTKIDAHMLQNFIEPCTVILRSYKSAAARRDEPFYVTTMKQKVYCCDGARDLYEYYHRQNGGEIPVFVGRRFQHGHGLGSILSSFFRRLVLPFFQSHGKKILANAVKTTAQVADDVLGGKTLKESAKHRIPTGIKRTLLGLGPQSGSGVRRPR